MTKIALFLFVFIIPFLGLSQGKRKINKALKGDYAVQLQVYDSLMQQQDTIIPIYALQIEQIKSILVERENQRRVLVIKKQNVINEYKTLIRLNLSKSLSFSLASIDSIALPSAVEKIKQQSLPIAIIKKEWEIHLDELSIKEQNVHITTVLSEVKEMNSMITQSNLKLVELMLKLDEKQHELDEIGRYLNSTDELLTEKMTYLFEQKKLAKTNFSTNGPKGFNESYFVVFPDVFLRFTPEVVLGISSADWERLSQNPLELNKALKSEYVIQFHAYDSLSQQHDSIFLKYSYLVGHYSVLIDQNESQRRSIEYKKQAAINLYKKIIQLDIANSLRFTFQELDSISIPDQFDKIKSLSNEEPLKLVNWSTSLDDLTIKRQNEYLLFYIERVKRGIHYQVKLNQEKVELIPELVAKKQELTLLGRSMDLTDSILINNMDYLLEQKHLAKKNFSATGCAESYFVVFPEDKSQSEESVISYVDEPAAFKGNLKIYLAENIVYPQRAVQLGIEGKCYLQFVVSKSGDISNVHVKRGVPDCKECDDEAVRVVKGMPNWIPAKNGGKPVNSTFNLPVSFKLPTE